MGNSTSKVNKTVNANNNQVTNAGLENFTQRLTTETVLRIFVDGTPGMGHQASSLRVLRTLAGPTDNVTKGFAYTGTIEVYYLVRPDNQGGNPLQKILLLLPELNGQNQGVVNNATVHLIQLNTNAPPALQVMFGFTGGADNFPDAQTTPDFPALLNVTYFLRLQPYWWTSYPNELQVAGKVPIPLDNVRAVGGEQFPYLAFYQPPPPVPNWQQYFASNDPNVRNRTQILNWLINKSAAGTFDLHFVYGVRYPAYCPMKPGYPEEVLITLITSVLQWQWNDDQQPWGRPKSAVIVNLDDFVFDQTVNLALLASVLNGERTREEITNGVQINTNDRSGKSAGNRAEYYVKYLDAPGRTRLVDGGTLQQLQTQENWLTANAERVLFLQLGPVPPTVYDYVYLKSTLPRLFEGMSTANLALNTGQWYFNAAQPAALNVNLYPTTTIGRNNNSPEPSAFQFAANQLTRSLSYGGGKRGWTSYGEFNYPGEADASYNVASLMRAFFTNDPYYFGYGNDNQEVSGDALRTYLGAVKDFYANIANCKLRRSLLYLNHFVGNQMMLRAAAEAPPRALAEAAVLTLEQLYKALDDEIKQTGKAQLIPGILSQTGAIGAFYADLLQQLNSQLLLDPAQVEKSPGDEVTWVKLSGTTTAALGPVDFSQGSVAAEFEFTTEGGQLSLSATFTQQLTYSLENVPWIQVKDPFLQLLTTDAALPTVGRIGATLPSLDLKVGFAVPAVNGQWLFVGDFVKPVSISSVYQLMGGINLQQALPGPFAALTTLGVTDLEFLYNIDRKSLDYVTVNAVTQEAVSLLTGLSLESLSFGMTVIAPLTSRQVTVGVSGNFKIGQGADAGVIRISGTVPGLVLQGQLVSGVIKIDDLLNIFLPGTPLDLPSAPNIDAFFFSYVVDGATWSVSCNLNINWTISDKLTIQNLSFSASNMSGLRGLLSGSVIILPEDPDVSFALTLTAQYLAKQGWVFEGKQTSGQLPLGKLLHTYLGWDTEQDYGIAGLGLSFATKDNSWTFTGKTAEPWDVPFISGLTVQASLTAGYKGAATSSVALMMAAPESTVALRLSAGQAKGYFARLETEWQWENIDIKIWFDYNPDVKKFGITWGTLEGLVSGPVNTQGDWVASLTYHGTLGDIVSTMVSWMTGSRFGLEAPWSFLNDISLNNLALVYTFNKQDSTRNHVGLSVNIGPIDVGFARIDGIDIGYQSGKGVLVSLKGSFPWNVGQQANGTTSSLGPWDASQPGTAPAPPGNGNKYFDLRLLAMGQHVTLPCFKTADTVQKAIDCMRNLPAPPPPDKPQTPAVQFDAESPWLIGTEFGVLRFGDEQKGGDQTASAGGAHALTPARRRALAGVVGEEAAGASGGRQLVAREQAELEAAPAAGAGGYFLTMQLVFNDPYLYGLRLKLDGNAAKIFKGLDFQIMYRQVSTTVGVYQAEITLPDAMRNLSIGAYSITLPVFGISVYTNGDFQVDIGFPWNQDFTRSFTIEGIIYPGIPVMGSAGFYFGKLSSATTNKVPQATNGTFNPVIVFGFGMQIGFGKSIQYGILSAGFSLTVVGILEGVIAKWNPYQITDGGDEDRSQVQGVYYFWLRGTIGIIGKLYGTVDFAIIKANVRVEIKLLVQLTYESYVSISITVIASVDVAVSVEINVGLFSISIDFSFSMRLKETFTMLNSATPPWQVGATQPPGVLAAPSALRLRAHARAAHALMASAEGILPVWGNLQAATSPTPLCGYLAPALAVAHDEWDDAGKPDNQLPCYVAVMVINSLPPANQGATASALKAAGEQQDTPFETLCKVVLRWVIAAVQGSPMSADAVDELVISDDNLGYLLTDILISKDSNPTPIPLQAVQDFLSDQFVMTVKLPDAVKSADSPPPSATYFPMPPSLTLNLPAYGKDYPGYSYAFSEYNSLTADTVKNLRAYFDDLAVQVEREMNSADQMMATAVSDEQTAMSGWIVTDYFLLLARQMTQAAREGLRDFKYPIQTDQTANAVIAWINERGELTGDQTYTLQDLFAANTTHEFTPGSALTVGVTQQVGTADTFDSVAEHLPGGAITSTALASANAANDKLLLVGAKISYPGQPDHTVQGGDTLLGVARGFGVSFGDLLIGGGLLGQAGLLAPGAPLAIPRVTYQALASDTFTSIAQTRYNNAFTPAALASQNAASAVLQAGAKITYPNKPDYTVLAGDNLGDVARFFQVALSDLLAQTGVLTAQGLLAPVVLLSLPPFPYTTAAGDTPQSVAAAFGVTTDTLAEQGSNGDVKNLFAPADSTQKETPFLDVPHLPQFRVGELIKEAQRALALQHLSGMASRYYLHGMRLPTDGITPNKRGLWVREQGGKLTLPPKASLYALTGQQFPLPVLDGTNSFSITFDNTGGPAWLRFADDQNVLVKQLIVNLDPTGRDALRISKLAGYARANRLDVSLSELGAEQMYESELVTYPFTSSLVWQSADAVVLPTYPPPAGQQCALAGGIQSPRAWKLPDAMINLSDPVTRAVNPRFSVAVARYDEATGATVNTPICSYSWASNIAFTIKRIPPVEGSPSSKMTYEIVGAGGNDIILLERLLDQVKGDEQFFDRLALGYQPDQLGGAAEGMQTDPAAGLTFGIAQVNLSTETRPPSGLSAALVVQDETPGLGLLNASKSEFIRLLWEASITRSGGFYLYYYNAAAKGGLPDRIFNDRNEATLTLLVLYAQPMVEADQNQLTDFMNAVVTVESIDMSRAVVFAQAAPPSDPMPTIQVTAAGSLASVAYAYYSDVGDLAQANSQLQLATQKQIVVSEGVFQSPPGGVSLSAIAGNFGTTVAEIQKANPLWKGQLPDPLPFPAAIWLPALTLMTGASPHTATLADVAAYYGENITSLAAHNRDVAGLFAPSQNMKITGGPRVRSATVPPGVQAVAARRAVPNAVPDDPNDPNYALYFLLNAYSLLNYSVAENVYFTGSKMGLPAGPTTVPQDGNSRDKVRAPRALAPGDPWDYSQTLPYPKFAKAQAVSSLPDPGQSPYVGIGSLLQVAFDWQDYYGNTLVTTLSAPQPGDPAPYNEAPMLVGYTDPLVGLGQWPSVASAWQVLPGENGGKPVLELLLTFDAGRYQGLLSAKAADGETVLARFTQNLDPASAANKDNYKLATSDAGSAAPVIQSSTLEDNQKTVRLVVAPPLPAGTGCTLTVGGVKSQAGDESYGGQATFNFPDDPNQSSSTLRQNAAHDLRVCQDLYYQLTDPNGVACAIRSSLLTGGGEGGLVRLTQSEMTDLLSWLFDGSSSIYSFLYDRSQGATDAPAPAARHTVDNELDVSQLNAAQVFELTLSFLIERTGGVVLGDLETTPGIRQSATPVAALTQALGGGGGGEGTVGLDQFARSFEAALSVGGSYLMKVATGVNRARLSTASNGNVIWAVRLGLNAAQAISYAITDETKNNPDVFAPRPISNELQTRRQVGIYDYVSGQGISTQVTRKLDFVDIDLDVWGRQFFAAVDDLLAPRFTAATQIVGRYSGDRNFLKEILDQKKAVAQIAKLWMSPVFKDSSADASDVREAFYQQMLSRLSNAYTARAGLRYTAQVNADVEDPLADEPPKLFGSVVLNGPAFESATAAQDLPSAVLLLFSAPMEAAGAQEPANYTVSGGLKVQAATLSADGTVVTLALGDDAIPGTTTVEGSVNLKDTLGRPLRPPRTQTVESAGQPAREKSEIGFSSPRLPLESGVQPLAFLLTAPDTVKGAGGQVVSHLDLDLVYDATDIEHQIGKVAGIRGYSASSWLSFVIEDAAQPLAADLGQCKVPLVLRSFPSSPAMVEQIGGGSDSGSDVLSDLTKWDYEFSYSLPFHYPQDRVYGEVEFNITQSVKREAGFEDAFAQLAEFVTVYQAVQADLEGALATIDATADPDDPDQKKKIATSAAALGAFIKLVGDVTAAADGASLFVATPPKAFAGAPVLTFSFFIQECSVDYGGTPAALMVTLVVTGELPEGVGSPSLLVDQEHYDCVPYTGGQACDGRDNNQTDHFSFVYKKKGTNEYLDAALGQTIAGRKVSLPGMDILQRQDAWSTVWVRRNEELVPGRPLADAFVYKTPDVQFASPFYPTIDLDKEISIPTIGSQQPATRTLGQHLEHLFTTLLKDNTEPTLTFQVEVNYAYSVNHALVELVSVPVLMQPPMKIATSGAGDGTLGQMINAWTSAITLWFTTVKPNQDQGTFTLDLVVMSNLTLEPMPLLRLRRLTLPIQFIAPPLGTT